MKGPQPSQPLPPLRLLVHQRDSRVLIFHIACVKQRCRPTVKDLCGLVRVRKKHLEKEKWLDFGVALYTQVCFGYSLASLSLATEDVRQVTVRTGRYFPLLLVDLRPCLVKEAPPQEDIFCTFHY